MKDVADNVRVWMVDIPIDRESLTAARADLTSAELRRADAYLHEPAREAFICRRSALRWILGRMTGEPPSALRFMESPFGKPTLVHPSKTTFSFNQAGCSRRTLIAVSGALSIGVDIEENRPESIDETVARRWFPPDWLESMPRADFLTLWTRAEAILKADGRGLSALAELQKLSAKFRAVDLDVGSKHQAALAVPGTQNPKIELRSLAFADLHRSANDSSWQDDVDGVVAAR